MNFIITMQKYQIISTNLEFNYYFVSFAGSQLHISIFHLTLQSYNHRLLLLCDCNLKLLLTACEVAMASKLDHHGYLLQHQNLKSFKLEPGRNHVTFSELLLHNPNLKVNLNSCNIMMTFTLTTL